MTELRSLRFVTINYSRLQGLKVVPSGLLLFLISLWTNAQQERERDLSLPLIFLFGGILVYAVIDGYYRRTFGRVEQTMRALWTDVIFSTAFSVVVLLAVVWDMSWLGPISLFPLVFASGLLLDYLRMLRLAGNLPIATLPAALICIGLIALSAFLPLAGADAWKAAGFRTPLFAVFSLNGILIVLYGLVGHLFLVRSMQPKGEVERG
jgi:hypothetical protein